MSFKAIDLQLAASRSNDAGSMQSQLQHKPVVEQAELAAAQMKQSEEMGQRSAKVEQKGDSRIKGESGRGQGRSASGKTKREHASQDEKHTPEHPFKGHHIDLSL